ncbi:MAG: rhomboid family intramembrane serine protease [Desulfurococcales archaeon]|nr:rhomboid family intramembrane serine protease [Desulfurococcales archaeon]
MTGEGVKPVWDAIKCELEDTSPPGSYMLAKILIIINVVAFFLLIPFILMRSGVLGEPFPPLKVFPQLACAASGGCLPQVLISMFAHAGVIHLLGNMFFLYIVGDNVEAVIGWRRSLLIYFSAGVFGAAVQAVATVSGDLEGHALYMVGASAAISGLVGAYLVYYPGSSLCKCIGFLVFFYCFRVKASNYFALWMGFQLVIALTSTIVAVWSHLAGLILGIALARLLADRDRIRELRRFMAEGVYRGLYVDEAELRQPSMSPFAMILVALAVTSLILVQAHGLQRLSEIDGSYYIVYADVDLEMKSGGIHYRIKDITYNISGTPPGKPVLNIEGKLIPERYSGIRTMIPIGGRVYTATVTPVYPESKASGTMVLAVYKMDYLYETGVTLLVLTLITGLLSLITVIHKPERYEVTYIKDEGGGLG